MTKIRSLFKRGESGQAMIILALAFPALLAIMWLAIEGGHVYVQHQQMQSAADMAALVGAQDIPCTTTDTTCINTAQADACAYAVKNGFACTAGGATGSSSNVPPLSCSPYDFVDYGNGSKNANCQAAAAPTSYNYVEVRLAWTVAKIPIFNIPFTLYSHAIASRSLTGHNNYVLMALLPGGITSTGTCPSTDCPTGIFLGSVYSAGPISGDGNDFSCGGQWYSSSTISNVWTTGTTNVTYAPLGCGGAAKTCPGGGSGSGVCGGGGTGQALASPNGPVVTDPYGAGSPPPTYPVPGDSTKLMVNCPECGLAGWWIDLDAKVWHQGGTPVGTPGHLIQYGPCDAKTGPAYAQINFNTGCSAWKHCDTHAEMFPGIYDTLPSQTRDNCIYMNPGVYTFLKPVNPVTTTSGDADQHNSILCIFGAPACDYVDSAGGQVGSQPSNHVPGYNCDFANFTNSSDGGNKFEYMCSPWGFWDASLAIRTAPYLNAPTAAQLPMTGPDYYNSKLQTATTVPLNGVVLYFPPNPSNPTNEALYTTSGASSMVMLAAPNPCPGTGTGSTTGGLPNPDGQTTGSVPFPSGDPNATYRYAADDVVTQHAQTAGQTYTPGTGSPYSLIYPTNDYTVAGECGLPYEAWPNEMPLPQRVQFLVYETGPMLNSFFGTDDMIFDGLFYAPAGALDFTGKFGGAGANGGSQGDSGAEGAPWLNGQAVVGTVSLQNAASLQLSYLACATGSATNNCPGGTGTQLVQ